MKKSVLILSLISFGIFAVSSFAGDLEPAGPPSSGTMHTLDEVYEILEAFKKAPEDVCTGVTFLGLRADGTIGEMTGTNGCVTTTTTTISGPRFVDNGDGTVTDTETNLIWLKDANCYGAQPWYGAIASASGLNSGECGLSDGSVEYDWHLATKDSLQGIGTDPPTTWESGFPSVTWTMPGSPFTNVRPSNYWSSTDHDADNAWNVDISDGTTLLQVKWNTPFVWPVRGGN